MRYWRLIVEDPPMNPVGRNELCPCGSGLKYKRCHADRKPRRRTVTFDFGRRVDPNEIFVSPHGAVRLQRFGIPIIPAAASTEESYERSKKPKTLYRFPRSTLQGGTNPNVLLEKYDHIFAIDTSTRATAKGNTSVVAVVGCALTQLDGKLGAQPYVVGTWQNEGSPAPEKSGWRMFIELLVSHRKVDPRHRIALIVDHDLDNLDSYNRRSIPVYEDFFLPENIDLIYAAADGGTDFLGARLIRMADREAARELARILSRDQRLSEPAA
jgi:hypothetical protein